MSGPKVPRVQFRWAGGMLCGLFLNEMAEECLR
jgi:hypothetical protein